MLFRFLSIIGLTLFFQACASQYSPKLVEGVIATSVEEHIDYYLYYPDDYLEDSERVFPVLLFLHGGGEANDSLGNARRTPPKLLLEGKKFPFLILAPHNPHPKKWWNTRAVKQLLDTIVAKNRIDKKRIYLTGLSRGGSAAWEMAVNYPNTFAAMAVVCGMTPVPYANWINKNMAIWVFHGALDTSIPISESDNMVEKLTQMGYNVKYTKYPNIGHNSWIKAYETDSLYNWFLSQELK